MLRKKQERALDIDLPRQSAFRLQGREVTAKVNRYIKEHPIQPFGINEDMNMNGNMGLAGMIPAISKLTWINDLTYIYTCSYPWRHQLLHTIRYGTSYTIRSSKSTCGFEPATLNFLPKPAE
jgi:hypothetical protein